MINNTVKMSEFTEITQVDETTKVVIIQGEPAFNAYIDASLLGGNISGETAARISADTSLSTSISTETSERLSADTSLSTSISTETSERLSADTSITNLISSDYVPYTDANKDVDLGDHTIAVDGIKLDIFTPYIVQNPGEIGWNSVEGTLDLRLLNNTTLQLGQEIHTYGRAVGNIFNGDPVQFAGVQGNHILIKTANGIEIQQNPYLFIGIATQNINIGEFGYVTYFGKVNGIYTEDWVSGDEIYFNILFNGLTNVKPNVPNRVIKVGYLIKAQTGQAENGILKVKISYGTKLTDLEDVNETIPTKGAFPVFQDEGYFDFTHNINDYALQTTLSTEISERISADESIYNTLSTGLSTEMSQRISTDASLASELATTTAIAKGAQQALSFYHYSQMVDYFNLWIEEPIDETTKVGQSIYIRTLEVPDIWISGTIFPSHIPTQYSYISDQKLIDDVNANGGSLQIGFYYISFLETQKVDLSGYALSSDLSTAISTEESIRLSIDQSLSSALSTEISDSISANTILSNSISSEISDRISGDLSLSTELSSEISRALSAESSLSTAISSGGGGGTSETFVDITLLSSNWSSNIQTVTAVGVTNSNTITVYAPLNRDQYLEYGRCQISATSQGADTLTFTNSENPLFDISLKISYR